MYRKWLAAVSPVQRWRTHLVACVTAMLAAAVAAGLALANAEQTYGNRADVDVLIDELVSEEGFDRQELKVLFRQAKRVQSILDAISRPAEKRLEWHEYRKIFVTPDRASQGVDFMREHADTLARAQRELGVPPEIVVAVIGVETRYGRLTGGYQIGRAHV